MPSDSFVGLALITLGGIAAASFYTPFKQVRGWTWETYWLVFGCISWVVGPWIAAVLTVPQIPQVLADAPRSALALSFIFGALWGVGSLTNGLAIRYMGLSLGWAIPLGLCAALGTLLPPVMDGTFDKLLKSSSGQITLVSVALGLIGIMICAKAGMSKDKELSSEQKQAAVGEFNLTRGLLLSVLAGVMSSCFAIGIAQGKPIAEAAVQHGTPELWQNTLLFAVILLGGFATNFTWCLVLSFRHRTTREFVAAGPRRLSLNYLLCILAGSLWYLQFLFYGMGETKMGQYRFAAWSVLMVCIIIFSNLWGLLFREWSGTSQTTKRWLLAGLAVLTISALMTGYGTYLATSDKPSPSMSAT